MMLSGWWMEQMAFNLASMHKMIVKEIGSKRSIRESMDRIIDKCEKGHPHSDWKKLRVLKYENLTELRRWIEIPFRIEPPKVKLAGLWFGLFNPIYDQGPVAELYVCGSKRFVRDSRDGDWATGPDWWPESRYANSALLARVYKIAYRRG